MTGHAPPTSDQSNAAPNPHYHSSVCPDRLTAETNSFTGSAFSFRLSAISYQLSAISYQLSAISYQLSAISYQLADERES